MENISPNTLNSDYRNYDNYLDKKATIVYQHHNGDISLKQIIPLKMFWGISDTHMEQQWFLLIYEIETKSELTLAMKNIICWR